MKKLMALLAGLALAALAVGCSSDDNANTGNANKPANSNTAVVTNTNTTVNANANANANKAPTKEDVEKNKETYGKQAKDAGRKVGTGANDMWLWVKTKYDLAAANDLRDSTINVDVENGVITLTGTVATKEQMQKADQIAKAVEGQKGVQNKLKVAAGNTNSNASANTKKK
ncbi:MAG TPA: BON domain-containing protein [Pyrinomonadaceae bacterium]